GRSVVGALGGGTDEDRIVSELREISASLEFANGRRIAVGRKIVEPWAGVGVDLHVVGAGVGAAVPRDEAAVVFGVEEIGDSPLADVGGAMGKARAVSDPADGRNEDGGENRDNGDDGE